MQDRIDSPLRGTYNSVKKRWGGGGSLVAWDESNTQPAGIMGRKRVLPI